MLTTETVSLSGARFSTPTGDYARNPVVRGGVGTILLLFFLLWLANRAALQAMDQPFPPRPALFLRLMLMLTPSRFKQLFSNLWVTHPILQPLSVWWLRSSPTPNRSSAVTQMRSASSDQKHGNNSMPIVAAMPELSLTVEMRRLHSLTKIVSVTTGNGKMPAQRGQLKPCQNYG